MKSCDLNESTAAAARKGQVTAAVTGHAAICESCADTLAAGQFFSTLIGLDDPAWPLPNANKVWVRAFLLEHQRAAETMLRPIALFQNLLWFLAAAIPATWLSLKWSHVVTWANDVNNGHFSIPSATMFSWSSVLIIVSLILLTGLFGLQMILAEE